MAKSRNQGLGFEGWNEEKSRSSQWAILAFIALSIPLALVPPQLLVETSTKPIAAPTVEPLISAAAPIESMAPEAERKIVVSIPDRKLAVVEGGRVKKVYRVAVGAKWSPSPSGKFHIVNKAVAPVYRHKGKVVAAGGGNPLGSRWMGLDAAHYGIHGTNQPDSIGQAASHGCIRMAAQDVQELFAMAQVGDAVEIHDTRTVELARIFGAENSDKRNEQNAGVAGFSN